MGESYNLRTFPLGQLGDHVISKGIVTGLFSNDEQNDCIKILIGRVWGKGQGRAPSYPLISLVT